MTDDDGGVHVLPIEVEVTNVSPSLEIGGPYRVEEGGKVTLAVKGSDPAESDRKTLIYAWDLDGDGTFEVNGRTVEFDATTLDGPLSHTVRVRVSDNDGGSKSGDVKIAVTNVPPTLEDDRKFVVDEGGKVDIRIAATDPSAADAGKLSFEWDLDGDGKFETSGETVVFDAAGIDGPSFRRVKVRVSDDDGGTVKGEVKVQIRNVAPSAVIIQVGG